MTEIYNDSFRLMGTNYHQKEALEIMKKLSKKNNYLTMSDEGIKEYILKTYSNVYEYKYLETNDVILVREPKNPHDPNAVKVLAGGLFAGYLPADIAKKVNRYVGKSDYNIKATLHGRGGKFKTLNDTLTKVISDEKEISFRLDLVISKVSIPKKSASSVDSIASPTQTTNSFWQNLFLILSFLSVLIGILFILVAFSFLLKQKILEFFVGLVIGVLFFALVAVYKYIFKK
ncbi:HIRAN domain-containing protein [Streptococcus suis]|uniref:HIRAN domain-containing protein n=1 Tax=Streptococcus suis TaxID=1307 RepID=UPI0015518E7C|nr:restriction endonuclease [Streptococcus suis]HEL2027885.1 restriction endonuclease [Streptococcus suis]HEM5055428.1 restriction endonuclease [Streptococcus suis]HEM5078105.1 restriction endonuclease [Streptococcus suis]HEM5079978.1 restriction endonuclease [Streptococcus suis]